MKKDYLETFEWCSPGRWRKGRHRNMWMLEVTIGVRERERKREREREKGNNCMEWIVRKDGRR